MTTREDGMSGSGKQSWATNMVARGWRNAQPRQVRPLLALRTSATRRRSDGPSATEALGLLNSHRCRRPRHVQASRLPTLAAVNARFHGFHNQHMYHPLLWFEGRAGLLLRSRLRPGRDASATGVVDERRHLLPPLRRRFPHTPLFLRGDAGMATPAVEAKLEAERLSYVLGIGTNRVFKARVAPLVAKAQARYERRGRPVHIRTSFRHRAKSWPHPRRSLVKIAVTAAGLNVRFMVTHRRGRAADLIDWYDDRGTSENWIKELKLDIHADRLSCHRFRANAVRPQLHSVALLLLAYFRRAVLAGTRLATATIGTIRLHLLKVAGRVVRSVRRLWFHLASSWPGQPPFTACHRALARAPA